MPKPAQHPRMGLSPEEAFLRWSDPSSYQELIALAGTTDLPLLTGSNHRFRDPNDQKKYYAKRAMMETAFCSRLLNADFFASAIDRYAFRREVIHPTLWELLVVHYELDEIVGMGRRYEKPEFFPLDSVPLNVRPIPDWLDAELGAAGTQRFSPRSGLPARRAARYRIHTVSSPRKSGRYCIMLGLTTSLGNRASPRGKQSGKPFAETCTLPLHEIARRRAVSACVVTSRSSMSHCSEPACI